jgi:putative SOS response-associated peptidase YedK
MCGRFSLTLTYEEIAARYDLPEEIAWIPQYNIAPLQPVPVVIQDGTNHLRLFKWGLVPYWAKDQTLGSKLINARAESLAEKPSFRHCLPRQRCLILADGFYEWKREGKRKIPYRFTLTDRKLFAFAGIWDAWKSPDGAVSHTCAILTTEANDLMRPIHDRMPVILAQEKEKMWLDPAITDYAKLQDLLLPYPAAQMQAYAVSSSVNSAQNNSAACIVPAREEGSLFD